MNLRPTDYESVALPLSYTGAWFKLAFGHLQRRAVPQGSNRPSIDPELRARLLQEARTPWRGLRRGLWVALAASGVVGLATMAMRSAAGDEVASVDLLIQIGAVALFGGLLWFDRNRDVGS